MAGMVNSLVRLFGDTYLRNKILRMCKCKKPIAEESI